MVGQLVLFFRFRNLFCTFDQWSRSRVYAISRGILVKKEHICSSHPTYTCYMDVIRCKYASHGAEIRTNAWTYILKIQHILYHVYVEKTTYICSVYRQKAAYLNSVYHQKLTYRNSYLTKIFRISDAYLQKITQMLNENIYAQMLKVRIRLFCSIYVWISHIYVLTQNTYMLMIEHICDVLQNIRSVVHIYDLKGRKYMFTFAHICDGL